ncbi:MAG: antitoxin [Clostridia bacterium]|nr:antitoxin [Clostridia bacterium]
MVKMTLNELAADLTADELSELENAERNYPVFDEDSPAMTAEQLAQFRRMNRENSDEPVVSIRISPATLQKAKKYGTGYMDLLSRLLDAAIDNEDLVRRCI